MKCPRCGRFLPSGTTKCVCESGPESSRPSSRGSISDPSRGRVARSTDRGTPRPEASEPAEPREIPPPPEDRFEVVRRLGRGGFGVVWMCRRKKQGLEAIEDMVAVKRLIAGDVSVEEGIERFKREVGAIRKLKHQSIVSLLDFDRDEYGPYLVMEYVDGTDLYRLLQEKGALSPEETIRIGIEVCLGLHYAHTRSEKVVHRDIKLSNIILSQPDGTPRIVDFGLARQGAESEDRGYGVPSGTWEYASPEQRMGRGVDHRTDIFSLGATLYHLATGKSPGFRIIPDLIPDPLRDVILRATAEEPQNRFFTMDEMRMALEATRDRPPVTNSVSQSPAPPSASAMTTLLEPSEADLCPLCGKHPISNHRFCPNTGETLVQVCPACKYDDNPLRVRFCVKCGSDIKKLEEAIEGVRFGEELQQKRDYDRALKEYEKAADLLQGQKSATELFEEAVELRDAVRGFLGERKRVLASLETLMDNADFDEAERMGQAAARKDPSCKEYKQILEKLPRLKRQWLLGEARKAQEAWDLDTSFDLASKAATISAPGRREAERFLGQVRRKRADYKEIDNRVARLLKESRYAEVLELTEAASAQFPNHPRLAAWAAKARKRLDDYSALVEQGNGEIAKGNLSQAESYFQEAEAIAPANDNRAAEGYKRSRLGRYEGLLDQADELLAKKKPDAAQRLCGKAREIVPKGRRVVECEDRIRAFRKKRKRRARLVIGIAVLLLVLFLGLGPITGFIMKSGNVDTALALHRVLGRVMINRGSVERGFAEYYRGIAETESTAGNLEGAYDHLLTAQSYDATNPELLERLVIEALKLGKKQLAAGELFAARATVTSGLEATKVADPSIDELRAGLGELLDRTDAAMREDMKRRITVAGAAMPGRLYHQGLNTRVQWDVDPALGPVEIRRVLDEDTREEGKKGGASYFFTVESDKEGALPLTFEAKNRVGVVTELPLTIVFDQTPPIVEAAPEFRDGYGTMVSKFKIAVEVRDESVDAWKVGPLRGVTARLPSGSGEWEGRLAGGRRWEIEVATPDNLEDVDILVTATDMAGNESQPVRIPVHVDQDAGKFRLAPAGGLPGTGSVYYTTDPEFHLEITTEAPDVDVTEESRSRVLHRPPGEDERELRLVAEDQRASKGGEFRFEKSIRLEPGKNEILAELHDGVGNEMKGPAITVFLDREPPRIEGPDLTPPEGGVTVTVAGTRFLLAPVIPEIHLTVEELAVAEVLVDGKAVNLDAGGHLRLPVKPGLNEFTVTVKDRAGNRSPETKVTFGAYVLPEGIEVRDGAIFSVPGDHEMVFVSGGKADIGTRDEPATEVVGPFLIDRREYPGPDGKSRVEITFVEATGIAEKLDKALPTEAEWCRAYAVARERAEDLEGGRAEFEWVQASPTLEDDPDYQAGRGKPPDAEALQRRRFKADQVKFDVLGFRCVKHFAE